MTVATDHVFDIRLTILSIDHDATQPFNSILVEEEISLTLVPPNNRPSSVDNNVCNKKT